ncbi:transcriptional regulator family: Fungal Specific TF [Penicillium roqueforti]|nr:transcriptional regulator family: Fungal Specific TF [Penicillium roqueforti]
MRRQSSLGGWDEQLLARKSFRAAQPQLFLDFISTSFPTFYFHNLFRSGDTPGFAENLVMNYGQDAYLDSAVCCLSSVYLAHLTQDKALLKISRQMYSQSLREVMRAIPKADHANSDNMLCTSIVLSVFEMFAQTAPDAWVVHSEGAKRLMISRGPAAHESGFGRYCWIAFRGFFIATAVYPAS